MILKFSVYSKYVIVLILLLVKLSDGDVETNGLEVEESNELNSTLIAEGQRDSSISSKSSKSSSEELSSSDECKSTDHCDLLEICNRGKCECGSFHERSPETGTCMRCPELGASCTSCCRSHGLTCWNGVCRRCRYISRTDECLTQQELMFIAASQVAIVTAVVMVVTALIVLIYLKCVKKRLLKRRNANRANTAPDITPRMPIEPRVSLTSMQEGVVNRLRDRPPEYATPHNFEYQNSNGETNGNSADANATPVALTAPVLSRTRTILPGEPPPSYDGNVDNTPVLGRRELPPPYSIQLATEFGIANENFAPDSGEKLEKEKKDIDSSDVHM